MPALVKVESSHGDVFFEGEADEFVLRDMTGANRMKDAISDTSAKLADVGETIKACAQDLLKVFDELATGKREGGSFNSAVIELGVKVTAEGRFVVAKGSVEANLKVTLNWDFS